MQKQKHTKGSHGVGWGDTQDGHIYKPKIGDKYQKRQNAWKATALDPSQRGQIGFRCLISETNSSCVKLQWSVF